MPAIRYQFVATGQSEVSQAFTSIGDAARQSSAVVANSYRVNARSASGAERATIAAAEKGAKATATAEEKRWREVEKTSAKIEKAFERESRAAEKASQKKATAETAAAEKRWREAEKASAKIEQAMAREERAAQRRSAAQVKANDRASSNRWRAVGGLAKDAAFAGVGAAAGMLGLVGVAARDGIKLNDISNRLSINSRGAGEKAADPTALRREFEAAALANPGIKAADIAEGAGGFVAKTGNLDAARRFSGTFATVASATGSNVQDIANTGADLFEKFDIKSIDEMRSALTALTMQGKAGAFELKDAAAQFSKMGAAAARFGLGKGADAVKVLGGMTQIARSATGSPEQAATAVEATFRQIIGQSKRIEASGAKVFKRDAQGKKLNETRDVRDIITDTISKSGGDLTKLQKIFGEEGIRGVSPLISTFNEAKSGTKGTEAEKNAAGAAAVRAAFAKAIDAPGEWAEIVKDSAQAQKSSGAQLDAAWEQLRAKVGESVVPALVQLAPKLAGLVDGIDPAVTTFVALAEAAGLVIDAFKFLGIIKPKEVSAAEKHNAAKKALEEFDKGTGSRIGPMTADEMAKRATLARAVTSTEDEAFEKTPAARLTDDEFAKRYAEMSNQYAPGDEAGKRNQYNMALNKAQALRSNPEDFEHSSDANNYNETKEQKALRHEFQVQATGDKAAGVDFNKLQTGAEQAAAVLAKIGQMSIGGSITGHPPGAAAVGNKG